MSHRRYEQVRDSGVEGLGNIPAHWDLQPLKRVASHNDEVLTEGTDSAFEMLYVDISSVSATNGISVKEPLVFGNAPSRARRVVRDGDVIVSTVRTYLRAVATIRHPEENLIVSTGFAVIRPMERVSGAYLGHLLLAPFFIDQVIARSVGVSYPAINASDLVSIAVPVPPIDEQRAIASFLDCETAKIDSLIAEQEQLIALLAEKRQTVISHAVTKGLDPTVEMKDSGVAWLGTIPAHWDCGSLARISSRVVVGIAEAATHAYVEDGTPILRATNIRAGKIIGEILQVDNEFAAARESKRMRAGDLVTVRTGNAGVTAIVPPELDGCHCFTMLITSLDAEIASVEYYNYWANSFSAQSYFGIEGWGTAQVNISVPILRCLPIPIPPLGEQMEIVEYLQRVLSNLDSLVGATQSAIALLQERRTALISAAVTGKIDVREHAAVTA